MNSEWFEKVVKDQIKMCEDVLINKAKEYSDDSDRLHNFKNAAGMMGCDAKEALSGMMAKHTISVYDMCRNGKDYPIELWNEKITDHINYLLLLKAVVIEEKHGIKIPSVPVFGTYYGLMEKVHPVEPITPNDILNEQILKDPHVKYAPTPGMTLMGNQFDTDEDKDLIERTKDFIKSLKICYGNDGCSGCMYEKDDPSYGSCSDRLRADAADLLEKYLAKKEASHEST